MRLPAVLGVVLALAGLGLLLVADLPLGRVFGAVMLVCGAVMVVAGLMDRTRTKGSSQ